MHVILTFFNWILYFTGNCSFRWWAYSWPWWSWRLWDGHPCREIVSVHRSWWDFPGTVPTCVARHWHKQPGVFTAYLTCFTGRPWPLRNNTHFHILVHVHVCSSMIADKNIPNFIHSHCTILCSFLCFWAFLSLHWFHSTITFIFIAEIVTW